MELAMVGLGRMGGNMARRLLQGGHRVVAYNRTSEKVRAMESEGAVGVHTLEQVPAHLSPPRVIWVMVPAGEAVDQTIETLKPQLQPGDILIDGGNSHYKDSVRRAEALKADGLHYLDAGTSGGIWGLKVGYCLMVGGEESVFRQVEPALKTLAPENGYALVGPSGAGHFAKMVHNAIEYGMLQAYGEGFEVLKASPYSFDLGGLAGLWNRGSVVRSWLLELAERAFEKDPYLEAIRGYVEDSGEGRWTLLQALEENVPAPVLASALFARFRSRQEDSFAAKLIAALRHEFGGHVVQKRT